MHEPSPCALCGYHATELPCPHCGGAPRDPSLARPLRGVVAGPFEGLLALPKGMSTVLTTRGIKRWLLPPILLTSLLMVAALWGSFAWVNGLLDRTMPNGIELDGSWPWLEGLSESWDWLKVAFAGVVAGAEWVLNAGWSLFTSQPLRLVGWFLLGSLVVWYCFSIAYEALAGPFLDEVQGKLEARWFGVDPRSSLERPNDIPAARCILWSAVTAAGYALLAALLWPFAGAWALAIALPPAFVPAWRFERRFLGWARWVARIEARALWVGLQATLLTGFVLVIALPLYFVPLVGYFLFAGACGFATAIGLLDIPFERRGWSFRQRARFIGHNLPALLVFGGCAGLLLTIPVLGPLLMVPSASIGGLWLICRLDKSHLREADGGAAKP